MSFAALALVCWSQAVMSKSLIELLWLDLFYFKSFYMFSFA
jgi:hypothetical protein